MERRGAARGGLENKKSRGNPASFPGIGPSREAITGGVAANYLVNHLCDCVVCAGQDSGIEGAGHPSS